MRTARCASIVTVLGAGLAACTPAATPLPPARYLNAPVVEVVNDRRDVPQPPEARVIVRALHFFDGTFHRRITRALELPRTQRAIGVNALDEVPDSTWFTNRIGVRELTPDELIAGPTKVGSPEPHLPWTIHSTKRGGESIGYVVTDSRGERFLLKFDRSGLPEVETAAHVIVNRLLWACGYEVPEDFVVYVRREHLRLAPDAVRYDVVGNKLRLTSEDVDAALRRIEIDGDGRIRGMASRMLDGKLLGGHPQVGVRRDDLNDRIPHERRRDLRGALPIFAWLDHVDMKEENTIDAWIEDPARPGRHFVQHYLLDFGKSLGTQASVEFDPRSGHEYLVDFGAIGRSFITLGLITRPWEHRSAPALTGVALFESRTYDPATWVPQTSAYLPLLLTDRIDRFWGAKILIRFTPAQLRALVASMRLSDPRAVDYLTRTLIERQRATARHAFSQVNPLDRFEVVSTAAGPVVCFADLLLTHGLDTVHDQTTYTSTSFDRAGRVIGASRTRRAASRGHSCTAPFVVAREPDRYTIVRIETTRPNFVRATLVHVARAPDTGQLRVLGIWRE